MKKAFEFFRSVAVLLAALTITGVFPAFTHAATDVQVGLGGNEPTTAAVNPLSPNIIAVARGLTVAISTDFGVTFPTTVNVPQTAPNPPVYLTITTWGSCGDASLTFDSQGRLFLAYLLCGSDAGGNRVDISAFVQQIDATNGVTVGNPVEIAGATLDSDDKEWIVADANPASPFRDNLYVVWTRLTGASQVMFVRSTDGGLNWSPPMQLDTGAEGFVWPSHIAVAPNGDVYITYHGDTCGAATAQMFVLRDTAGGAQFQAGGTGFQKTSFTSAVTCNVQSAANPVPNAVFWMQGANQGFVIPDPIRPNQVYVVVNDDPNDNFASTDDAGDIKLARSTDNGLTWSVNTISHGPVGTLQVYPTGAIDQLGNLVVTWWDTRRALTNGAGNFLLDQYATVSRDGGLSFTNDFRVSDFAFDPDLNAPCRFGPTGCGGVDAGPNTLRIGEYNGTAAANGAGYNIWTGNNGTNPPSGGQVTYFDAFSILGAFPDALEPNDSWDPGVASVLGADGTYLNENLTIHTDLDEDFFKVVALSTGKLSFTIDYNSRYSDLDIQVRDKFNNVISTSTALLDTNDVETITIPAVAGQVYFARVFAQAGQVPPINEYSLSIVNTPAPVPFSLVLAPGSDTGSNSQDNVTNLPMPTILLAVDLNPLALIAYSPDGGGTLADDIPGYKVEIYRNGTAVGRATPVGGQPGIFTYTFTSALTQGLNFLTARVVIVDNSDAVGGGTVHAVGSGGESYALLVTLDTTAPVAGDLGPLDLLASSDTGGIDDDNITTFSTPSFSLQVNVPGFVRIYAQNLLAGPNVQVAQFQVTNPNVWQFTVPALADGVYNITATIEDNAGNVGPPTAALKVTIAKFTLTLPGLTLGPAGPVTVDLEARTVQGYSSVSLTGLVGINGIPVVNLAVNGMTLTVNLTAGDDAFGYTPSGANAGGFALGGVSQLINFINAGLFTVNPLAGNDTVTTFGTAANDAVTVNVNTTATVQVGNTKTLNMPALQVEKIGISTAQGNDAINVNVYGTVNASLFVDGGEPTTVNKGNDALNLFDKSTGKKGVYSNISGGGSPGAGAVLLTFKGTGKSTRVDYVGIEKQTRK